MKGLVNLKDISWVFIFLVAIAIIYYFFLASKANKNKKRIIDLLVIGLSLMLSPRISKVIPIEPSIIAGFLIFAYGWILLIVDKFYEGLNESDSKNHEN